MTSLDVGIARLRSAAIRVSDGWLRFNKLFKGFMPKGLYARSLLIIIAPMVILQSVVAFVFMERHWNLVTQNLSAAVVQDIAALMDIYKSYPQDADQTKIKQIAQNRLGLVIDFLPLADMPPPGPKPFFSLLDQALSVEIRKQISRPYWIDTVGRSKLVEIRIQLDDNVLRVFAKRSARRRGRPKEAVGTDAPRRAGGRPEDAVEPSACSDRPRTARSRWRRRRAR